MGDGRLFVSVSPLSSECGPILLCMWWDGLYIKHDQPEANGVGKGRCEKAHGYVRRGGYQRNFDEFYHYVLVRNQRKEVIP